MAYVAPSTLCDELVTLLASAGLLSDTSDDAFVTMLVGIATRSSVHDAIVVLMEYIVTAPLTVTWTDDFVSFWRGVYSIRRNTTSPTRWAALMGVVAPLLEAGMCTRLEDDEFVLVTGLNARVCDAACVENVPWRMLALKGLVAALARIGHAHRQARVAILQGVQAAARRVFLSTHRDSVLEHLFPSEFHRDTLAATMDALPAILAYGWQSGDAGIDAACREYLPSVTRPCLSQTK